jgi:hypothetical protein
MDPLKLFTDIYNEVLIFPFTSLETYSIIIYKIIDSIEILHDYTFNLINEIAFNNFQYINNLTNMTKMMYEVSHILYFQILCCHYEKCDEEVDLPYDHPANGCMAIVLAVSGIITILDNITSNINILKKHNLNIPEFSLYDIDKTIPHIMKKKTSSAIKNYGIFISKDKEIDVDNYACSMVINSISFVASEWYRLSPSNELLEYLLSILHRSFIMIHRVASDKVYDIVNQRRCIEKNENGVISRFYSSNYDFIRRISGGLTQMIISIIWRLTIPIGNLADLNIIDLKKDDMDVLCDQINNEILTAMKKIKNAPTLAKERREIFNCSALRYGDTDVFIELCNDDPKKPSDIMFSIRPPQEQSTLMIVNQMLAWENLCKIKEYTPNMLLTYNDNYSSVYHFYSQDLKLYIFEFFFDPEKLKICVDHYLSECYFIKYKNILAKSKTPTFVRSFGRIHVVYLNIFYECKSIEQAFFIWILIIKTCFNGIIEDLDLFENNKYQVTSIIMRSQVISNDNAKPNIVLTGDTSDF